MTRAVLGRLLAAVTALAAVAALGPAAQPSRAVESAQAGPAEEQRDMELIANLPVDGARSVELYGGYAYIGAVGEGLVIVDISDPRRPRRVGLFPCAGGTDYDVKLSRDGRIAFFSTDEPGAACRKPGESGTMVLDVSDPRRPRELSFIPVEIGTHTQTLDNGVLYVNNYWPDYAKLQIFDVSDPASPKLLSELDYGKGQFSVHDLIVDHRPDGRTLAYAGSITASDVIDVTNPRRPQLLQRVMDPEVQVSIQAEPNPRRDVLVVADEYGGPFAAPTCGKLPTADPTNDVPGAGAAQDYGALHFYRLTDDGIVPGQGVAPGSKLGTFNLALDDSGGPERGCTTHLFWQSLDENRLVAAWYGRGIRIVDYSNPKAARELGAYVPPGTRALVAEPHNGYIYTADGVRGMDVLAYTGEGGSAWPASAGPAEAHRAVREGRPLRDAEQARGGDRVVQRRVRVRAGRGHRSRASLAFTGPDGRMVATVAFGHLHPGVVRLRVAISGPAGRYRYAVRSTGAPMSRGSVRIPGARLARGDGFRARRLRPLRVSPGGRR